MIYIQLIFGSTGALSLHFLPVQSMKLQSSYIWFCGHGRNELPWLISVGKKMRREMEKDDF